METTVPIRKMMFVVSAATCLVGSAGQAQNAAPTPADFEKMYDRLSPTLTNYAKVTSVDCTPAGSGEWRCQISFEKFLDGPAGQPALGGYYRTTVRGIYGLAADGKFGVLRNYELVNQQRASPPSR